jgi:hypothetical protein
LIFLSLKPVGQGKADADLVHELVAVDQAFTAAVEVLNIALREGVVPEGKAPGQFDGF